MDRKGTHILWLNVFRSLLNRSFGEVDRCVTE